MHPARNKLLTALPVANLGRILLASRRLRFHNGDVIHRSGRAIDQMHFIESGVAALSHGSSSRGADVALIGVEGMLGGSAALGVADARFNAVARSDLRTISIEVATFHALLASSSELRALVLRYIGEVFAEIGVTAHANARLNVEERVARWLAMAATRLDAREISMSHSDLAAAIGCRRAGVTAAMHRLEERRIVQQTRRNLIQILDLEALGADSSADPETDQETRRRPQRRPRRPVDDVRCASTKCR
jgi:CRP-like cAMP-binding protein